MSKCEFKETLVQVFSCEFCEIYKNTFCTEHHWTAASGSRVALNNMTSWTQDVNGMYIRRSKD